ncbi:inner nuclear membrane protein enriched at telomere/subtelomere region [Mortierella sp. GBA30]|nr:inner nuclear membrane protein enriched at telomere/subtelomere region [Mortierella sp. GBA30]
MDQIREILVQHHVKTPTGIVRKQQLVDLFIENIKPQVPELEDTEKKLNAEEHKGPATSSKARQQRRTKAEEDDKKEPSPSRPARIRRASSKARMNTEEALEVVVPKPKRSNSRVTAATAPKDDSESKTLESPRGRKPRKTDKADLLSDDDYKPTSKSTSTKAAKEAKKAKSNNFSNENPFQSGSEERGRSKSRDSTRSRSRSRQSTKRVAKGTDKTTAREHAFKVPARPAFSKFMHAPPEEKVDESSSRSSAAPSRARTISTSELPPSKPLHLVSAHPHSSVHEFVERLRRNMTPVWLGFAFLFLAYGVWYRQTRIEIGFCTPSDDEATRAGGWFYPSCIPCPDHATCLRSDAEPICPPEYLLKPQLLSFGNLLPLTPVCVLNKAKAYQSLQVADAAEKLLQIHAGQVECSMTRDSFPKNSVEYNGRRGISTDDLRFQLEQLKDTHVSVEDFMQYWDRALKELRRRSDNVVFEHGLAGEERVRSLKPRKSLGCRLRQLPVGWVVKFKFLLFALLTSALGAFYVRSYMLRRQKEAKIVNGLVQNVLIKLSDQAHYYYVDPVIYPDPWLSDAHLRDALLADVHSAARRHEIWEKVQAIVERNANVRLGTQEMRGEVHRTWEWVGASGVLSQQYHHPQHRQEAEIASSSGSNVLGANGRGRARGRPKIPQRVGAHGSFFGMTRQDSEYMNPENPLYPSLSQEYQTFSQE